MVIKKIVRFIIKAVLIICAVPCGIMAGFYLIIISLVEAVEDCEWLKR